ncbi:MAG: NifB/NifX family molybdenum-iron cluster-binding protein [Coriobacteriia bacterium]|nr:NifB/NifX family molybdenum-iron cluster-binding protein [Coriobacteriia bacterium]
MKVAVSAVGPTLDDKVDERFGRARYFLITDGTAGDVEVIDNSTNRNAMQAAGIASAELVADHGVEAVVTGHLGPKAFPALGLAGIKGYSAVGMTVREALEALAAGTLVELTEAGQAFPH